MAWSITINGDDSFANEVDKLSYEVTMVELATELVANLSKGYSVTISAASVTTDTTGTVSLLNDVGSGGGQ